MNASGFLAALGRSSAQAGALALLILVAQTVFRRQIPPHWRCALWLLVAARLLVPVSLHSAASLFNLVPPLRRPAETAMRPPPGISGDPQALHGLDRPLGLTRAPAAPTESSAESAPPRAAPASGVATAAPPAAAPTPAPTPFHWSRLLLGLWLTGALAMCACLLLSTIVLARRFRPARRLRDPAVDERLRTAQRRLGLAAAPLPIHECDRLGSPALYGCWRPRLLLPAGFVQKFSAAELDYVLLHELAHVKRRDLPVNWLLSLLQAVHWFNPLVWLAFARWRADRELACDALALEAAGPGHNTAYGRTILRLLESFVPQPMTPGLVGILEDKRRLRQRISQIASFAPRRRGPVFALALTAGLALIGLTDAQVAAPASSAPSSSTTIGSPPAESALDYATPYTFTTLIDFDHFPGGVAVNAAGKVFAMESGTHIISKIGPDGGGSTMSMKAGNNLSGSTFIAADAAGNLYTADTKIRKISPDGVVTVLAGNEAAIESGVSIDGVGSAAQFDYPQGIAVDQAGNVYIADALDNTVRKITPTGVVTTLAGLAGKAGSADGLGSAARFNRPMGVAVDEAGNIYVADSHNYTIRKVTPAGLVTTMAGKAGEPGKVDGIGSAARFGRPQLGTGGVDTVFPVGVAVDKAGNVYVADMGNGAVRKITSAGVVTTLGGSRGELISVDGTGSAAQFSSPYGIAVDGAGTVYVTDFGGREVKKGVPAAAPTGVSGASPASRGLPSTADRLEERAFPLSRAKLFRIIGPNVSEADVLPVLIERVAHWGVGFAGVPGSSFVLKGDTLVVRQTAYNLDALAKMLAYCGDPPRTELWTSGGNSANYGGETGRLAFDIQMVDASPEDLRAIDPEKFRTKPSGSPLAPGERFSTGDLILGEFDVAGMVRALEQKSGGRVLGHRSATVSSGMGATMDAGEDQNYRGNDLADILGQSGRRTEWAYTTRVIGNELRAIAVLEEDNHTILLPYISRHTTLTGWLEFPTLSGASPIGPFPVGSTATGSVIKPLFATRETSGKLALWDGATLITSASGRDQMVASPVAGPAGGTAPHFLSLEANPPWPTRGVVTFTTVRVVTPGRAATAVTPVEADPPAPAAIPSGLSRATFALPREAMETLLKFKENNPGDPFDDDPPAAKPRAELEWFKRQGVDFASVPGASLTFTGTGIRVTQTAANLEKIRAIAVQLSSRTNVAIEARMVEMSAEDFAALDLGRYLLDGSRPGTLTIPVGSESVDGGSNTPPPLTGRFDIPALLRALTQPPGRSTLLAVPDMIVLPSNRAMASAGSELIYPQSYGETPSPAAPGAAPAPPAGTPQDFTVRALGAELMITVAVDDDGHTIRLKDMNAYMTVLANGAKVGDGDRSIGAEAGNPAWPTGGRPVFEFGDAWGPKFAASTEGDPATNPPKPDEPQVPPQGYPVPDGGTAVFAMVPVKENFAPIRDQHVQITNRSLPERRMLMLITARIVGGSGR